MPDPWPHRISININDGNITADKDGGNYMEVELTDELFDVLTTNIKNVRKVRKEVKNNYMSLVDFCIGDELKNLAIQSTNPTQEIIDLIDKFRK